LEEELAKPGTTLFNSGAVTLILGFLASVGITFSWNVGVLGPFILALGLAYLYFNLGFLTYLVKKSNRELVTVIFAFLFIALVTVIPKLIIIARSRTV
jgi:hypothetical protein